MGNSSAPIFLSEGDTMKKKKLTVLDTIGWFFTIVCAGLFVVAIFTIYAGKEPADYHNTKWVATDPDIWFTVDKNGQCAGQLKINGRIVNINIGFDPEFGDGVYIGNADKQEEFSNDRYILTGSGKFRRKKMVVEVYEYYLPELEGIEEITFVRMDEW
jgi:hypothetical protein